MSDFHDDDSHPRTREPRRPAQRTGARGGGATYAGRNSRGGQAERPYNLYRAAPRSLGARMRGETDAELEARASELSRQQPPRPPRAGGPGWGAPRRRPRLPIPGFRGPRRPRFHPIRLIKYFVMLCIFWVVLSIVLFFVSASGDNIYGGSATRAALSSAGPMLFTPNNILVVGLDTRPKTGYSSHEKGSNFSERYANTDTLMIWRVGGGVSRKLSVPRDTLVNIPGCGMQKINAAWACGGPQETIRVVEQLTGVKINHMIVVALGNFVNFINDIGGVTVKTPRMCATISGGAANGGYTVDLKAGMHHLNGVQAISLARVRHMPCDPAYTDFNREQEQQQIMNGIKNQLFSLPAFIHLPWASWDAPKAVQTDMGPLTMMQLFAAAEMGGSSKPKILGGAFGTYNGADVVLTNRARDRRLVQQLMTGR